MSFSENCCWQNQIAYKIGATFSSTLEKETGTNTTMRCAETSSGSPHVEETKTKYEFEKFYYILSPSVSPTNETRTGTYLVPRLSKVSGNFHWSHKKDHEREFYCSGPVNGNENGNFISQVPLMRPGRDNT